MSGYSSIIRLHQCGTCYGVMTLDSFIRLSPLELLVIESEGLLNVNGRCPVCGYYCYWDLAEKHKS